MAAAAAAASAQPAVDATALQQWCLSVDARLDAADTATTGIGLHLDATVGQAKGAMEAIVQGVRVELFGVQQQFRADHEHKMGQLNGVVAHAQQKFAEVEGATQQKFSEVEGALTLVAQDLRAKLAQAEARATRTEQRVDQLLANAPPLGTPASTPPPSPRRAGGAGGAARFDPWQAPRADPWQAAAAAPGPLLAPLPPQLLPPGIAQAMPNSTQFYGIGTPRPQQRDFKVDGATTGAWTWWRRPTPTSSGATGPSDTRAATGRMSAGSWSGRRASPRKSWRVTWHQSPRRPA